MLCELQINMNEWLQGITGVAFNCKNLTTCLADYVLLHCKLHVHYMFMWLHLLTLQIKVCLITFSYITDYRSGCLHRITVDSVLPCYVKPLCPCRSFLVMPVSSFQSTTRPPPFVTHPRHRWVTGAIGRGPRSTWEGGSSFLRHPVISGSWSSACLPCSRENHSLGDWVLCCRVRFDISTLFEEMSVNSTTL